ncbi:MAG: hypothetical protein ACYDEA_13920, partial [Candidatus Dormibacteria bacterium]
MPWPLWVGLEVALTALAAAVVYRRVRRRPFAFNTVEERATLRTLAFATSAVSTLRQGLTARTALKVLRSLVLQSGGMAAAIYDGRSLLAFQAAPKSGAEVHGKHLEEELATVEAALGSGRTQLLRLHATEPWHSCPLRTAV